MKEPDITCLMETKLTKDIPLRLEKEDYTLWRRDREAKRGGGVMVMIQFGINDKSREQ